MTIFVWLAIFLMLTCHFSHAFLTAWLKPLNHLGLLSYSCSNFSCQVAVTLLFLCLLHLSLPTPKATTLEIALLIYALNKCNSSLWLHSLITQSILHILVKFQLLRWHFYHAIYFQNHQSKIYGFCFIESPEGAKGPPYFQSKHFLLFHFTLFYFENLQWSPVQGIEWCSHSLLALYSRAFLWWNPFSLSMFKSWVSFQEKPVFPR